MKQFTWKKFAKTVKEFEQARIESYLDGSMASAEEFFKSARQSGKSETFTLNILKTVFNLFPDLVNEVNE